MLECGFTAREIAVKIGCESYTTIHNECTIIRRLANSECSNAVQLTKSLQSNEKIKVSIDTVCRALRRNGLASRVKRKKPLLSKKHCEKWLKFAKRFKDWIISDWSKVFDDNSIEVLPWPPQSSDLNLIEHLWNDVDRRLRALNIEIRGKDALWEHVSQIWNKTALETCIKLIESMLERIQDVINVKGEKNVKFCDGNKYA
ncbi:IS630 family transposase [Rhizophagus clarus]|uniref:IS630 family transposase n=1 Tax=Rhizophagus clarus TaxID=94130 RepID=A0A8H3KU25_9GLOM|nr:IS630 family transposase [Rhizophagus clarus]